MLTIIVSYSLTSNYCALYLQLEQEMAMVSEKPNVKASFLQQWKNFVPAIIECGDKSPKKNVKLILCNLDDAG